MRGTLSSIYTWGAAKGSHSLRTSNPDRLLLGCVLEGRRRTQGSGTACRPIRSSWAKVEQPWGRRRQLRVVAGRGPGACDSHIRHPQEPGPLALPRPVSCLLVWGHPSCARFQRCDFPAPCQEQPATHGEQRRKSSWCGSQVTEQSPGVGRARPGLRLSAFAYRKQQPQVFLFVYLLTF